MDKEAADKLIRLKRHSFVRVVLFSAVVLPLKSNVVFIEVDEPRVSNGDAVWVLRSFAVVFWQTGRSPINEKSPEY